MAKRKQKKQKSEMQFELIGGIYIVEKFPDGKEKREEIDGEVVLKLLLECLRRAVDEELV